MVDAQRRHPAIDRRCLALRSRRRGPDPGALRTADRSRHPAARLRQAPRRGPHPQHGARTQGPRRGVSPVAESGPTLSRRVGIDVGGTKAQAVVLDPAGGVIHTAQRPTPRGDHSLDALIDVLIELADTVGHEGSIGVGVPGLVTRTGVLRAAPNLDGVSDFAIAELLSARFGSRVHVDNDATCATVAEWLLGAGVGAADMVLITLGTGVGGGVVANGALQRGANGFAGEFGHMV